MKIILSPSKTQSNNNLKEALDHPKFYTDTKHLLRIIKTYRKDELAQMMRLKEKLLDEAFESIHNFKVNNTHLTPAIQLYTGVVYKSIDINQYNEQELEYLNDKIRIMSALYGVLSPMDGTQVYRLDFTMKLKELSLVHFWKCKIVEYFKDEELIIDCASLEFSQLLSPLKEKVHRIEFIDCVDGQEKIISYNAKKLRGLMVNYCITHQVEQRDELKAFCEEGYLFQAHRSDASKSIFIRYSSSIQT